LLACGARDLGVEFGRGKRSDESSRELDRIAPANRDRQVEIARIPELICGFGRVKTKQARVCRSRAGRNRYPCRFSGVTPSAEE